MIDALAIYTLGLTLGVMSCAVLSMVGFSRIYVSGSLEFGILMIAATFYALGNIFEIRGNSAAELQLWLSVEYIGVAFLGPLWLLLSTTVAGVRSKRVSLLLGILFGITFVSLLVIWTNDSHHFYYASLSLERRGPFSVAVVRRGPWYWFQFILTNICIVVASIVLLVRAVRAPAAFRGQSLLLFAASLFPWVGMSVYLCGYSPYGLDLAPFALSLSGLVLAWSLFRYRFVDLGLIAYERVLESMSEGILVLDRKGRIVATNPVMLAAMGKEGQDCVGGDGVVLLSSWPGLAAVLTGTTSAPVDLRRETAGWTRHYSARLSAIVGRGGRKLGSILSLNDITERVELTERLAALATQDSLTGILNRRSVLRAAHDELARASRLGLPLSLLMLDLDEFKRVNDRYGHQAGDAVLKAATQACGSCLRCTDRFGRYGGEEFLALLPGIGEKEALAAAERLRAAVAAARVEWEGEILAITVSVGCSGRTNFASETVEDLVREADAALYRAKMAGRNRVELRS